MHKELSKPLPKGAFNQTKISQVDVDHQKYLDQSKSNHVETKDLDQSEESNLVARAFSNGTDELHLSHARPLRSQKLS